MNSLSFLVQKRNEKGKPIKLLFTIRNIDKQKEMEVKKQRLMETRLQTMTEAIHGGFKLGKNDAKFSFIMVSEQLAKMLGYETADELIKASGGCMAGIADNEMCKSQIPQALKVVEAEYWSFIVDQDEKEELHHNNMKEKIKGKHILLAEDNDMNAEIAILVLTDAGVIADRVEDGIQCVTQIENHPAGTYDMIFMDIQMPFMDGYKATQTIRNMDDKEKANIPIVAMTANAFEEDRQNAFKAGMNMHIAKPIDEEKIEEALALVLP